MMTTDESDIAYESYKNHYQEIYDMIFDDMVKNNFINEIEFIPTGILISELHKRGLHL